MDKKDRILQEDLEHIFSHTKDLWPSLRGKSLFITGGTGFFGRWLLETFLAANSRFQLGLRVFVLSRNPEKFLTSVSHFCGHFDFISGDVRNFDFPTGRVDYIIHSATDASAKLNKENPELMFQTIVDGTKRVLEFARITKPQSILLTSSGAVYNRPGVPDTAYSQGKRAAEELLIKSCSGAASLTAGKIARCFAFVGPFLPMDAHYAIGNFVRDGLAGKPIGVNGDGSPIRSYLYAADLVIWLLRILVLGKNCEPYDVGSGTAISIKDLAEKVAARFKIPVNVIGSTKNGPTDCYLPKITDSHAQLGLKTYIELDDAIDRMIEFYS